MQKVVRLFDHFLTVFRTNSLFRNSIYLMGSTIIMSIMGFGFWVFVAHLYTPADIGNASALISLSALLTNVSMLGINASLLRFLARAKDQSRMINAAIIIVGAATIIASLLYLLIGSQFSSSVRFFTGSPLTMLLFAGIMAMISVNSLTDAVFIANRRAEFHTIAYAALGLVRLIAPLFLIAYGSWGIFTSYVVAMLASLLLSFWLMRRACDYRLFAKPDWSIISIVRKYGINNYIGVLLAGIPTQIMPMLIVQNLGAANAAFYSMAWTMANLLYVIPTATTQSLLAETSHDQRSISLHIRATIRMLTIILVPVILLSVLVAPFLLEIFGTEYSMGSTRLFQLFAFATIFMAINSVGSTMLNIERRNFGIIIAQLATLVVTLGSVAFLWEFGLLGVGAATLLGLMASNTVFILMRLRRRQLSQAPKARPTAFTLNKRLLTKMMRPYGIQASGTEPLTNGSSNHTFLIRSGSEKYVLRVYQEKSRSVGQIKTEVDFMAAIAESGVPVPKVLSTLKGSRVSRISLNGSAFQYILMSFEEGSHPDAYSERLIKNMAAMQARIHRTGLDYASTIKSAPFGIDRLVRRILPLGYSHFDFDGSNILVSPSNSIKSVLDFEGMRFGPLCVCLYFSLEQIYQSDNANGPALIRRYLEEYTKRRRPTRLETMFIATALSIRYHRPSLLTLL